MSGDGHRVGVDVGGTFTDVVSVTDGHVSVEKVPTTPAAPDDGVIEGLDEAGLNPEAITLFSHGTTVATNTVLESSWAATALITTEGFRDVLEIGRQARPKLYDLQAEKPAPIVPRDRRFEVCERLDDRGDIITPLEHSSVEETVDSIAAADVESVAICLLFSFEHDAHERQVAAAIAEANPEVALSCSSVVLPEIREYERTLATALNAALKPVIDRYLDRLQGRLADLGVTATLHVMQSNGGVIGTEQARERPISTLLSGPAAGVQGAAHIGRLAEYEDLITMDMGGTSCDVSLIEGGSPLVTTDGTVGAYSVSVPMVEVHTIGAGGGSIGNLDAGGALQVGPQSAGADPGPICYGRGGTEPTVTDAHVVLGRIDPDAFISDAITPDPAAAREGIRSTLADPLDHSVEEAAAGILAVANAQMEGAIRVVSVERGHDPRSFALVAFGGAGPLHAPTIARSLEIPRILVPRSAGALSAFGLVSSDLVHEFGTSRVRRWDAVDTEMLHDVFAGFERDGRSQLAEDGHDPNAVEAEAAVDMRYVGQSFTLRVPVSLPIDDETKHQVERRFHDAHEERYGYASPTEPIELVTVRMRVRGRIDPPNLRSMHDEVDEPVARASRDVWFDAGYRETPIYHRDGLPVGSAIAGPAVIEGSESTVLIHPDQHAEIDPYGTMVIEPSTGGRA